MKVLQLLHAGEKKVLLSEKRDRLLIQEGADRRRKDSGKGQLLLKKGKGG